MSYLFQMKQKSVQIRLMFNAFGHKFKNMIQNIIKKVLRKWLKKKLYKGGYGIPLNEKRFAWVYNSPIRQWKDRIWVLRHTAIGSPESFLNSLLEEYLYK